MGYKNEMKVNVRPTIHDVANLAGVSISTVSRVINGAGNVNSDISSKVYAAIHKLGYRPNSIAQSLKSKITQTIGIVAADLSVDFFSEIIRNIEHRMRDYGYSTLVTSTYDDPKREKQAIQLMVEKQVDALVIAPTGSNDDFLLEMQNSGLKIFTFDRRPNLPDFSCVFMDKVKATYLLAEYLIDRGHKDISLVTSRRNITTNYDRFQGLAKCFYDRALILDMSKCFFGTFSPEYGQEAIQIMADNNNLPTAVIAGSVVNAVGVLLQCRKLNIRVPEDISVVTYGHTLGYELMNPMLTLIADMRDEISDTLVNMLVDSLIKGNSEKICRILEPKLWEGTSVCRLK